MTRRSSVVGDDHTAVSTPAAPWDGEGPAGDHLELARGTQLGEYRIEAEIGQGGMGVVYSAIHPLIGKRAAIKILKQELCEDPITLERFIDEARVVNQIGHPNIVDIFAFGAMPDGRSYFVMEWLQGETLRARIARGPVSLDEIAAIVRPLARALQAAHDQGVVHRDLKPDNIFLVEVRDEIPTVKLLDFGIAKLASNDHRVERTATGAIVGTPQYIAPEQAKGYAVDHRADIYALGGILFELLTGRPPFIADNAMEMVAKHLMEIPARPATLADGVPPELDELVMRMLEKLPDARPSLAEVRAVFEVNRVRAVTPAPVPRDSPLPGSLDAGSARRGPGAVALLPPDAREVSTPVASAISQRTHATAPRRPRILWLALAAVPLVGVLAFLVVDSLGSAPRGPAAAGPSADPPSSVASIAPAMEPPAAAPPTAEPPALAEPAPPAVPPVAPTVDPAPAAASVDPAPAARPVVKPARGTLSLTIGGGGDRPEVLVDGVRKGLISELAAGRHDVEVRARGMQTKQFQVMVRPGKLTTQRVTLVRLPTRPKDPPKPPGGTVDENGLIAPGTLRKR